MSSVRVGGDIQEVTSKAMVDESNFVINPNFRVRLTDCVRTVSIASCFCSATMDLDHDAHDSDATEDQDHPMENEPIIPHEIVGNSEAGPVADLPKQEDLDFPMDQGNLTVIAHKTEEDADLLATANPQHEIPTETKPILPVSTSPAPEPAPPGPPSPAEPAPEPKPSAVPKPQYKHQYSLSGHTLSISSLKFSPSGAILASSGVLLALPLDP